MATRPATAPDAAPSVVALPSRIFSTNSQPSMAAAVAVLVLTKANPERVSAASSDPALNPNQPNQSSPVPSSTKGRLCGRKLVPGQPLRRPRTRATAMAAAPAFAWTTVPPAKSSAPFLNSHPSGENTQCAIGEYTTSDQIVTKTAKAPNFQRSAVAPVISAGVMIANMSWKATKTIGGITWASEFDS